MFGFEKTLLNNTQYIFVSTSMLCSSQYGKTEQVIIKMSFAWNSVVMEMDVLWVSFQNYLANALVTE